MEIQIISPEKTDIFKKIKKISIPTLDGVVQILENHAESFFLLKSGKIIFDKNQIIQEINNNTGEVYVKDNIVKIIL